jgi:hypothetical protein
MAFSVRAKLFRQCMRLGKRGPHIFRRMRVEALFADRDRLADHIAVSATPGKTRADHSRADRALRPLESVRRAASESSAQHCRRARPIRAGDWQESRRETEPQPSVHSRAHQRRTPADGSRDHNRDRSTSRVNRWREKASGAWRSGRVRSTAPDRRRNRTSRAIFPKSMPSLRGASR